MNNRLFSCATCVFILALVGIGCATKTADKPAQTAQRDYSDASDVLVRDYEWPTMNSEAARKREAERQKANQATQQQLRRLVSLESDLTLKEVVAFIRDTTGVNIAVNWPALELVEIEEDSLVPISLTDLPAETVLRLALDHVSADAFDDDKAGHIIDEGVVKVSTLSDLKTETTTLVYGIQWVFTQRRIPAALYANHERAKELIDLIEADDWIDQFKTPGFDLNDALSGTSTGRPNKNNPGGGGEGGLFGEEDEEVLDEEQSRAEVVDSIVELIHTTVGDPDEWLDEESIITELNGNLIVKTTSTNHDAIAALLRRLRISNAKQLKSRLIAIEVLLLLEEAEALRLKQDYPPALKKLNQALRVDPTCIEAKVLKEIITDTLSR